jgi:hypothetical protein
LFSTLNDFRSKIHFGESGISETGIGENGLNQHDDEKKRSKECEWNEQTSSERRKRTRRLKESNANNENGCEGMLV